MKISGKVLAIAAAVVIVLVAIILITKNNVTNAGNKKEATLNSQYLDAQNFLSDCEVKTVQAANVATAQVTAFDKVITDAVKGRYSAGSSAQVGNGAFFSAIREAYPDLSSLAFNKVLDIVNGCRTDYRGKQSELLDRLRDFDSWRTGSLTVRTFGGGFPNDNLKARLGDQVLHGRDAEDKMFVIILTGSALKEYQNGQLDPNTVVPFPTTTSG
jgi:hypothetical protein